MAYQVGTKVIYPPHGVAEVVGRTERVIDGEPTTCLVLSVAERGFGTRGAMTVTVPEERAESLGVRFAIDSEEAEDVMTVLAVTDVRVPANWSRRFKNHQEKLRSGDLYGCAEVVRNLARRDQNGGLSSAERSMYLRARHLLVSELAVSWGTDDDSAAERVDAVLGTKAPKV